jgi:prophage maintenance system killer protein
MYAGGDFLELNGMKFTATEASVVKMTLGLASGKAKERVHGEWLEENSVEG